MDAESGDGEIYRNRRTRYFENECTDGQNWYPGQEHKTINLGYQEVTDQGHTRPEIDLED